VLTAEATVDGAADFVAMWDTSASAIRKVLPENLPVPTGALNADGTVPLTADWDAGAFEIRAETFESDIATGTAPIVVASTTVVANLNADKVDGTDVNDVGTTTSDLWTASKIQTAIDAAVVGLYDHKGEYDASANSPDLDTSPSGILKGDAYTVSVAGTFYAVAVEAGDVLIADQDSPTTSAHWTIVNRNIDSSAFATASHTHATTDITSGTFADARIAESNVTQHEAALTVTESQISDLGSYSVTGHAHAASDITSGTLSHERGGIEADISGVAIGDVLAGTGTGTIGIVTSTGHSDGDVLTIQADGTVDFETPSGGGVTDHGALTGLSDDDHPQYAKLAGETFTGVHDFGGATSLEIPNGAAPTVDAAGEIAVDTTITDYTGMVKYHDGTEELTVLAVPTANLSTTDGEVVAYNATNDELEFIDVVGPYLDSTLGGAASGDVLYHDGTQWTNLAKGSDGEILTLASGLPSWSSDGAGLYQYMNGVIASNRWVIPPTGGEYVATTVSPNAGSAMAVPIFLSEASTFDNLSLYVETTGTATLARMGLYSSSEGFPDSLIDEVEVSVSTTGQKSGAITSGTIGPGMFYLVAQANGTITLRSIDRLNAAFSFGRSLMTSVSAAGMLAVTHTYGALPDPFGTPTQFDTDPILLAMQKV